MEISIIDRERRTEGPTPRGGTIRFATVFAAGEEVYTVSTLYTPRSELGAFSGTVARQYEGNYSETGEYRGGPIHVTQETVHDAFSGRNAETCVFRGVLGDMREGSLEHIGHCEFVGERLYGRENSEESVRQLHHRAVWDFTNGSFVSQGNFFFDLAFSPRIGEPKIDGSGYDGWLSQENRYFDE